MARYRRCLRGLGGGSLRRFQDLGGLGVAQFNHDPGAGRLRGGLTGHGRAPVDLGRGIARLGGVGDVNVLRGQQRVLIGLGARLVAQHAGSNGG